MKIRVYYEDTDAGGIVYHTNYIKYCERARSELFFEKNMQPTDGEDSGFVVRHIDANFLGMAFLGELLEVRSEVLKKRNSSLILKQSVFKEEKTIDFSQNLGVASLLPPLVRLKPSLPINFARSLIFEMEITLVFVREGKPSKIPEKMIEILVN